MYRSICTNVRSVEDKASYQCSCIEVYITRFVCCRTNVNKKREEKKRKRAEEEEKAKEPENTKVKPVDASAKGKLEAGDAHEAKKGKAGDASHDAGDAPEAKRAKTEAADDKDGVAMEAGVPDVAAAGDAQAAEVGGTTESCLNEQALLAMRCFETDACM